MAMAMEVEIAIVGGGLGGLALAIGLQERGIRAHVFEKAPKVRAHTGTAITLAKNGIKALDGIKPGLGQAMLRDGHYVNTIKFVFRHHSEPERVVQLQKAPGELLITPWRCAQEVLAAEITDHNILHWRHSFLDFNIVEGGVEARFEVGEEGEELGSSPVHTKVVRAKLLVGVDGIRSQVRKVLVGDEPRDLLLVTWNAVVPAEDVRSLNLHEEREIKFMRVTGKDREASVFLLDAGAGLSLWQVRVADVSGEITKAYAEDLESHGRGVRKVRALRQVEGVEELENMRAAMEGTNPDAVREARACDRLPLTTWSDSSKRVVLLGDAAHGMYSGPGEGARTAFEDAHQLSILLHEALDSPSPESAIADAVRRYEEMRIPRTTKIQGYAAESTGWPHVIPEWVRELAPAEKQKRNEEFGNWVKLYPEAMAGDPDSTYWKP